MDEKQEVRLPITAFFNDWQGVEVVCAITSVDGGRKTQLFGRLIPGEDSWGKPAFLLPTDARPRETKTFGEILTITDDGRVIPLEPYSRLNSYRGSFILSPYTLFSPPSPVVTATVSSPPTDEEVYRQALLTPSERAIAWSIFWPEWVVRKGWRLIQSAWGYAVALHILWSESVQAESRDSDGG